MLDAQPPFQNRAVEKTFESFPAHARLGLLELRRLIFEVASETTGVGVVEETLKWRQPAYLTPKTKSGSTIRLGTTKQDGFAIYTHCQTTIMSDFQSIFPDNFVFEGNRAIHFQCDQKLPLDKLRLLIRMALTYHLK